MEILKTTRFCAVAALAALTMTACSDDDDNSTTPEKEVLVTKMEQKVKYVMKGYEEYFPVTEYDCTEMKYDGQGRLIEWVDNGKCAGYYTYEKGKILVTDDPINGSIEYLLNDKGQVTKSVFADGTVDKVTYNDKGQCVEVNQGGNYRTLFEWTGEDMTFESFPDLVEEPARLGLTITYSEMPKKSNAPFLRCMMYNANGYRTDMEVAGALHISSEKYLPEKAVMEWEDGYQQIYEATYERDTDGLVTEMHVTMSQRDDALSKPYPIYIFDEVFTYQQK